MAVNTAKKPADNVYITKTLKAGFTIKADGSDDSIFRFEALGAAFGNVDSYDDVLLKGCFVDSLKSETPVLLWQHDRLEPIGVPEVIHENDKGLFLQGALPKADTFVSGRVIPQMEIGSVKEMSVGIRVVSYYIENGIRYITKCLVREISLVTFAANKKAKVIRLKHAPNSTEILPIASRETAWDDAKAEQNLADYYGTNAEGLAANYLYSNKDDDKDEEISLFPFVDVVKGERQVIPAALFKARAEIEGDNPPDVSAESKSEILAVINQYTDIINDQQPLDALSVDDLTSMNGRDLEKHLRDSGMFSRKAAVLIASKLSGQSDSGCGNDVFEKALKRIAEKSTKRNNDDFLAQLKKTAQKVN